MSDTLDLRFYHLTTISLDQALPQLLALTLERNEKALVRMADSARVEWLDDHLWTFNPSQFLPHGILGGEFDQDQPILLTTAQTALTSDISRDYIFWIDGFSPLENEAGAIAEEQWPLDGEAKRLCIMFSGGNDEERNQARRLYRLGLDCQNVTPTYWQQSRQGQWSKAA